MKETLPPLLLRTAAILADSAHLLLQIEDSITPLALSEQLTGLIHGARLEVIAGSGHLANLEQDLAFNTTIDRFLSEID